MDIEFPPLSQQQRIGLGETSGGIAFRLCGVGFGFSLQKIKNAQAKEPVWQPRFPQLVSFVEANNLNRFNKSES